MATTPSSLDDPFEDPATRLSLLLTTIQLHLGWSNQLLREYPDPEALDYQMRGPEEILPLDQYRKVEQAVEWASQVVAGGEGKAVASTSRQGFQPRFKTFPEVLIEGTKEIKDVKDVKIPGKADIALSTAAELGEELPEMPAQKEEDAKPYSMASLGSLPPELKQLIVEHISRLEPDDEDEAEDGEEDLDEDVVEGSRMDDSGEAKAVLAGRRAAWKHTIDSYAAAGNHAMAAVMSRATDEDLAGLPAKGEVPSAAKGWNRHPLFAIAAVNREFAALAQPFIWNEVDLADDSISEIAYFLTSILPRHGHHVEILRLAHAYEEFPPASPLHALSNALLALTLLLLPRVHSVSHDFGDRPERPTDLASWDAENDMEPGEGWLHKTPLVSDVLRLKSSYITDLSLEGSVLPTNASEPYFANFLGGFPNLERLAIEGVDVVGDSSNAILETIASMSKLSSLSLSSELWVNWSIATVAWKSRLTVLALAECDNLSIPALLDLIKIHSASLEVLDLDDVPHSISERDNKKYLGKPLPFPLPKLNTLVLTTDHDAAILDWFANVRLETLEFGYCPRIAYSVWEGFIRAQGETLKSVTVEGDSILSDGEKESLEVLCFAKKIECEIREEEEESDSEGEYSEGDGEMYEWEDEDGDEDDDFDEDDE